MCVTVFAFFTYLLLLTYFLDGVLFSCVSSSELPRDTRSSLCSHSLRPAAGHRSTGYRGAPHGRLTSRTTSVRSVLIIPLRRRGTATRLPTQGIAGRRHNVRPASAAFGLPSRSAGPPRPSQSSA